MFFEPVGEFAADTFDDRGEGDGRHLATYKWLIRLLTIDKLQIRPMTLGDYLARHFRQMSSAELGGPEIRHVASGQRGTDNTTYADSAAAPDDIPWSVALGSPFPFSAPPSVLTALLIRSYRGIGDPRCP